MQLVALFPLFFQPSVPEPQAESTRACDPSAIEWVLPGHFEAALARARAENRILLIQGVSFGIDAIGACDARRGRW